jgi:hypothetical protein
MKTVICLQIPTTLWNRGKYLSLLLNIHRVRDVRQVEIHNAKPLVPEPSPFVAKIAAA